MSTDQISERDAFNQFIDEKFGGQLRDTSLEEAVAEFRTYQKQLEALRAKLRVAEEQSARGESRELDMEEFLQELDTELARKGIPE